MRVNELLAECTRRPGASTEVVARVQKELAVTLPDDYLCVVGASNGVEGFVGETYLTLWPVEQLPQMNAGSMYEAFASGVVLLGSNGASEGFAIVTSADPPFYVAAPMGAWHEEDIIRLGTSFEEFLLCLSTGYL